MPCPRIMSARPMPMAKSALLEAISEGVIPVSVCHTPMADYICPAPFLAASWKLSTSFGRPTSCGNRCTRSRLAVCPALHAQSLAAADVERLSCAAVASVRDPLIAPSSKEPYGACSLLSFRRIMDCYLEISPLFERHWSGIPVVTAEIASCALSDAALRWGFAYENIIIERPVVEELLTRRDGSDYLAYLERQLWAGQILNEDLLGSAACVFTNMKALRGIFQREALIVHDISTLLTPEFHNQDTIHHHANRIRSDFGSTDMFFCVSRATEGDVQSYFRIPAAKTKVLPMGVSVDPCTLHSVLEDRKRCRCEPFICVLGTIEPRKNGRIVLQFLREFPSILSKYEIVFVGQDGWNDEKKRLLEQLQCAGLDINRIVFTGFVSEETKLRLLLGCRFCIYPSFFEGYGLPVAEASALGKYVVCSRSSSLTEIDPDMCFYFDPFDVFSLSDAFGRAKYASDLTWLDKMSFLDTWRRIQAKNWRRSYDVIRNWIGARRSPASVSVDTRTP
jgi:glycosyltransferase involved in cell wall biosynthesis